MAIWDETQENLVQLKCEMIHPVANDPLPDELTVALPIAQFNKKVFCKKLYFSNVQNVFFSSLRAESARAVTGRRCPHSGEGEDFLTCQLIFFTKTAVTPERKVEKSIPRWEINRHAEG